MNAGGSNVHAVTAVDPSSSDEAIAGWSFDSTRLLVDKVGDDRWVQIIDVGSHTVTTVTKGTAGNGAWFHN